MNKHYYYYNTSLSVDGVVALGAVERAIHTSSMAITGSDLVSLVCRGDAMANFGDRSLWFFGQFENIMRLSLRRESCGHTVTETDYSLIETKLSRKRNYYVQQRGKEPEVRSTQLFVC